jgi:hypothetical protein
MKHFLVAVKRMGNLDALSREFARAHSERLWEAVGAWRPTLMTRRTRHTPRSLVVLGLAVAAALADQGARHCSVFRSTLMTTCRGSTSGTPGLFVFPLLTFYFVWKRGLKFLGALWLALPFAAGAVFANIYPFHTRGDTEFLTALHLPIALWLAVGFAYGRGRWFADGGRMNFVRFSGEWVIYYVLMALGGGVLTGFTFMMFRAIGMNPAWFVAGWLLPCGGGGGRHHRILARRGEAKCH